VRRRREDRRYVGKGEALDDALAKFSLTFADQTERDYELLAKTARSRRIKVAKSRA
jgi:hypothetical protein